MIPKPESVVEIIRELADGSIYRICSVDGCVVIMLQDHEGERALSTLTPIESFRLCKDIDAVASAVKL